jgi:5'-nucleotidase
MLTSKTTAALAGLLAVFTLALASCQSILDPPPKARAGALRILISNDDGIDYAGIAALAEELGKKHEVLVVAPDRDQSGAGHSISTNWFTPRLTPFYRDGRLFGYAVNGTPAVCVMTGVIVFGKTNRFDLVVSGVNGGKNTGVLAAFGSGTEGAARQGCMMGIPAIAVSQAGKPTNFLFAARFVGRLVERIQPERWKEPAYWSINIPEDTSRIKGVRLAPLTSSGRWAASDVITVKAVKNVESAEVYELELNQERFKSTIANRPEDAALEAGYISISPRSINTSHESAFKALKTRAKEFDKLIEGENPTRVSPAIK